MTRSPYPPPKPANEPLNLTFVMAEHFSSSRVVRGLTHTEHMALLTLVFMGYVNKGVCLLLIIGDKCSNLMLLSDFLSSKLHGLHSIT